MKSIVRFCLLCGFVVSCVVLIDLLALQSAFFSPQKVKELLAGSNAYDGISTMVNKKLQESGEPVPFAISPRMIQSVSENIIDQTGSWISGNTTTPPTLSLYDLIRTAGGNDQMIASLKGMKKELDTTLQNPEFQQQMKSGNAEGVDTLKQIVNSGGTISLGTYLSGLKQLVSIIRILIPLLAVWCVLHLLGILVFCPNNQSRSMWLFSTFFLLSGALLLGSIFFNIPKLILPSLLSQIDAGEQTVFVQGILSSVIVPVSTAFYRFNMVAFISSFCLSIIFLLARIMLFRSPTIVSVPKPPANVRVKKSKQQ